MSDQLFDAAHWASDTLFADDGSCHVSLKFRFISGSRNDLLVPSVSCLGVFSSAELLGEFRRVFAEFSGNDEIGFTVGKSRKSS